MRLNSVQWRDKPPSFLWKLIFSPSPIVCLSRCCCFFKSELICEFIGAVHLALYANINMWTLHFL